MQSERTFVWALELVRGVKARSIDSRLFLIHVCATFNCTRKSDLRTSTSLSMSSLPPLNLLCSSLKSPDTVFNPVHTEMVL